MKDLNVNGKIFQYEIFHGSEEAGDYYWTKFYDGNETVTHKKYLLFGPVITKEVPKEIFKLGFSVEDSNYTAAYVRGRINSKLELMDRKLQIERGEII